MPGLTDSEIKAIFVALDMQFNGVILNTLTHGMRIQIYTHMQGVLFSWLIHFGRDAHWSGCHHLVDYWSIPFASFHANLPWPVCLASRKKDENYRWLQFFCGIIILLYLLVTFNFCCQWEVATSYFGAAGKSFAEAYQSYYPGIAIPLAIGIDTILSTVLADATLV